MVSDIFYGSVVVCLFIVRNYIFIISFVIYYSHLLENCVLLLYSTYFLTPFKCGKRNGLNTRDSHGVVRSVPHDGCVTRLINVR